MAAPARPTATILSINHETREIVIAVSGTATVFRAEVFDLNANVVTSNQISAPGTLSVFAPQRGVSYSVVVIAGDGSVPVNWSEPGLAVGFVIRPLEEDAQPEEGIGITTKPSTAVENAGPLGVGLAFPFRFSETTGAPEVTYGIDHVVDGMRQILLTRRNGRFIRRDFGSPIAGQLFQPDTKMGREITISLEGALAEFEHRAEVTGVVIKRDRVNGIVFADINFRVFRTHQSGNLVYPFDMGIEP